MGSAYYLVTGASYLIVALVILYAYFAWRDEEADYLTGHLGVLGALFLIPAIINIWWGLSLTQSSQDAFFINGTFSIFASVLMLIVVYKATQNKNLLYILGLFALALLSLPYSFTQFFASIVLLSHLLFLIVSLDVLLVRRYHMQLAGAMGAVYGITGTVFAALLFFGMRYESLWWFALNPLLAGFIYLLHLDRTHYALITPASLFQKKPRVRRALFSVLFARYILYIIAVTALTFITTVSVHELGHAVTAQYYGCEPTKIIYDLQGPPYTEIHCSAVGTLPITLITVAGTAITLAVAGILYFTEGPFTTRLAQLFAGFGFLISYRDFQELGFSPGIIFAIMLLGLLVVMLAVIRFSLFYISEHSLLKREFEEEIDKLTHHANRRSTRHVV